MGDVPLVFDQNGASTTVSFKITNVGNTPALNVTPHAWLVVLKQGGPFPLQEQQRRCNEIRQQPFGLGFTLFPGENFPSNVGYRIWSLGVNITREEIEKGLAASIDGKHIATYIIGCIDYTFPSDVGAHHQTGFILELRKNTAPYIIDPDEGTVPVASLVLRDTGIDSGRHAD
jgi:hypothetical protein